MLLAYSRTAAPHASVLFSCAACAADFTAFYGHLASWPIGTLFAADVASCVCAAVACATASHSGRWTHAAAGAAGRGQPLAANAAVELVFVAPAGG